MTKQGAKPKPKTSAETNGQNGEVENDVKAALLAEDVFDTVDIDIEGIGTVTVRPLSRHESHLVAKKENFLDAEVQMIVLGMVQPELTFAEAKRLTKKRAGIMQTITNVINEISGMGQGADTKTWERFRDESGS